MRSSRVSVSISSFGELATEEEIYQFLDPFKPTQVRVELRTFDIWEVRQVVFADFTDATTANLVVEAKHGRRFMGEHMRVELASANRSSATRQQASRFGRHEVRRGNFETFSMGIDGRLVALEEDWKDFQRKLSHGMQDYSTTVKCGVEVIAPDSIYAVIDAETNQWRRCRRIRSCGSGQAIMENIDYGQQRVVSRDQLLKLSPLWSHLGVKAVDLRIDGFTVVSAPPELARTLRAEFEGKTFEVIYHEEEIDFIDRKPLFVSDVRLNGRSVLADWERKGMLRRC